MRGIESLLQILPVDPNCGLHRLVAWLSSSSRRIDWDPLTLEISIDGNKKENSSIVDILMFLWNDHDDESVYPTSHTFGTFVGISRGTTRFLLILGEEMYSQGLIKNDPHSMLTEDNHVAELASILSSTYSLNEGKIMGTLKLSYPERRRVADVIERVCLIKIALCGLRWFKLNVSKYQKDVKLSKRCQMSKNETPRLWRRFTKKLN